MAKKRDLPDQIPDNVEPKTYYSTSQVEELTGIPGDTIRYWSDQFHNFLQIKRVGTHRRFTKEDIERLKYIEKLLKEKGMTHKQAIEFLNDPKNYEADLYLDIVPEPENSRELFLEELTSDITTKIVKHLAYELVSMKDIIEHQTTTIEKLESMVEELQSHNGGLMELNETMNKKIDELVAELRWQNKPWYKKLFSKKKNQ